MAAHPRGQRGETRARLLEAAAAEFNDAGFDGTDTNRIARRAGFAPQTFYRWFEDKIAIFIEVYHAWQAEEAAVLGTLIAASAPDEAIIEACVTHHAKHLRFRRSLRNLSCEHPRVRAARAQSRQRQVDYLSGLGGHAAESNAEIAAVLLQLERLSDALAEGEFRDMGVEETGARAALAQLFGRLRGQRDSL